MTRTTKGNNTQQLALVESLLGSLLDNSPKLFLTALNNVSAHGEAFSNAGLDLDNEDLFLKDWFDSLDKMNVALNRLMTSNYYNEYAQLVSDFKEIGLSLKPYPYKKITNENDKKYLKQSREFLKNL